MTDNRKLTKYHTMHQVAIQRKNLTTICRLAVKSLIDKACFESIEDNCEELVNFLAIMEHMLTHRMKPHQTWYGSEEPRWFWDYMRVACKRVPHNCLSSIENLERPRTARGKGRAWLRVALMEKRLAEYLAAALQQTKLTRSHYQEGSLMLSEEVTMLSGVLLGLNAIDFSFDIRSDNLDMGTLAVIDFTPYLKFEPCPESLSSDQRELNELTSMAMSLDSNDVFVEDIDDTWKARYLKLDGKLKMVCEQKGYLEELVRLRESQLEEVHGQRKKLIETLQHYERESQRERQQLEAVIIELQAQMMNMKDAHELQVQRLHMLLHKYSAQLPVVKTPDIALSDIHAGPHHPMDQEQDDKIHNIPGRDSPQASPLNLPNISSAKVMQADSKSIMSDSKSILSGSSSISVPPRDLDAQSNHSMIPLVGSFTSEISFRSNEIPLHPVSAVLQSGDSRPANDGTGSCDPLTSLNLSQQGTQIRLESAQPLVQTTGKTSEETDAIATGDPNANMNVLAEQETSETESTHIPEELQAEVESIPDPASRISMHEENIPEELPRNSEQSSEQKPEQDSEEEMQTLEPGHMESQHSEEHVETLGQTAGAEAPGDGHVESRMEEDLASKVSEEAGPKNGNKGSDDSDTTDEAFEVLEPLGDTESDANSSN